MLMTLNRTYTLRSTMGYTIAFQRGEPIWVPPRVQKEAVGIGAQPVDGHVSPEVMEEDGPQLSEKERLEMAESPEGPERERVIKEAILEMVAANDTNSFTGGGYPDSKALSRMVGFRVDANERNLLWDTMQAEGEV